MDDLRFSDLRKHNVARSVTCFHPLESWSETDWATATAGELGEMCNKIKKLRRGEMISYLDIADEMADTVIYLDLLAARMGIDLGASVRRKFNRTSVKKGYSIELPVLGFVGNPLVANTGPLHEPAPREDGNIGTIGPDRDSFGH